MPSKVNHVLLAQAVRVYTAASHQRTSQAKTRAEVNRTTAKWYKQKGTGNARHGAKSAPIFVGGGVAHGPRYTGKVNLKLSGTQKRLSLQHALIWQKENIIEVSLSSVNDKTRQAVALLKELKIDNNKVLLITEHNIGIIRSFRNIQNCLMISPKQVNALDVLSAEKILITKESMKELENRTNGKLENGKTGKQENGKEGRTENGTAGKQENREKEKEKVESKKSKVEGSKVKKTQVKKLTPKNKKLETKKK